MLILNRRLHFDYNVHETVDAGISLTGAEVKSIRKNSVSINGCYVSIKGHEAFLLNWNIPKYEQAYKDNNYDPCRPRRLLLKKTEVIRMSTTIKRDGYTVVVSKCYTNKRGYIKLELALVSGKKQYDKREYIKKKDERREGKRKFNNI